MLHDINKIITLDIKIVSGGLNCITLLAKSSNHVMEIVGAH